MTTLAEVSSPNPVLASLREVRSLVPRVLRKAWLPILIVHVGRMITDELFTYSASLIQARGREDLGLLVGAISSQFLVEMAWTAIWAFVIINAVRAALGSAPLSLRETLARLNRLLIEGVRAMAAILYRVPLLIVPALLEFVRLMFVPHVVLLDEDYERGRADALSRSRELTKGYWTALIFSAAFVLTFDTYVTILAQGSTEAWAWEQPLGFLVTLVVTLFTGVAYEVFLVALFLKLSMMRALRNKEA